MGNQKKGTNYQVENFERSGEGRDTFAPEVHVTASSLVPVR